MTDEIDFAVVDVETTGFFPERYDRVIEIAVIRTDANGARKGEFATLVNPDRDLGPTEIHGITARDVAQAPTFAEIAGDVVSLLRGAVFVAHNVSFDRRFVCAELRRMGCATPHVPCLCTMQLSRQVDPRAPGYRLSDICRHFGICAEHVHSAYDDASAATELLHRCLKLLGSVANLRVDGGRWPDAECGYCDWPDIPPSGKALRREYAKRAITQQTSYLASLGCRLPPATSRQIEVDSYLDLLDRVLEDRRINSQEADSLLALGAELGLSRADIERAHDEYFRSLLLLALRDGHITDQEHRDLCEVGAIFGISDSRRRELEREVRAQAMTLLSTGLQTIRSRTVFEGKSVCFTGTLDYLLNGQPLPRTVAEDLAQRAGMLVRSAVTKDLDFLVAGDPDTMSSKAKKARAYGVRILAESVFWNKLGVDSSSIRAPADLPSSDTSAHRSKAAPGGARSDPGRNEPPSQCPPASGFRVPAPALLLAGKTIVVTGTLKHYSRGEIEALIRQHGGKAASSVSKKTDYLVAGEAAGSKLEKAHELGVRVLREEEFERLLRKDES